jgi:hypothetical protein
LTAKKCFNFFVDGHRKKTLFVAEVSHYWLGLTFAATVLGQPFASRTTAPNPLFSTDLHVHRTIGLSLAASTGFLAHGGEGGEGEKEEKKKKWN